jgi:tetraprenyl-beta-curcumene synthase
MPLSPKQLWALIVAALRELLWGLWAVSHELHAWRLQARAIPDAQLREDALSSLVTKRTHADGAALFTILPRRRDPRLLRVLVAYEVILDYLDNVHERSAGYANGCQLHMALIEALDPERELSDYYRHHLWHDDGGYLRTLVETCRADCARLPGYARVRASLCRETTRALVLAINHDADPVRRDEGLKRWAERECQGYPEASWFELSSAASASLTIHALLALASEAVRSEREIEAVRAVYFPWVSATSTMLDSYVDQVEDASNDGHSYMAHYPSSGLAARRMGEMVERSAFGVRRLRNGHRHAVIAGCMVAMYLSKDSARVPSIMPTTTALAKAGGSLTKALLPVLRLWRILYSLRAA